MSRDLERRLAALERATWSNRVQHTVSDRLPGEEEHKQELAAPITELEWIEAYGEADPGTVRPRHHG